MSATILQKPISKARCSGAADRRGDLRRDLLDRLHVDERADHSTRFEAVCDLHGTGGLGEALGKGVIDAVLHQDAVGAHAGLAGIAIFRGDRTLDRHLDIGVVKDDTQLSIFWKILGIISVRVANNVVAFLSFVINFSILMDDVPYWIDLSRDMLIHLSYV